jgi:hypothetical protein
MNELSYLYVKTSSRLSISKKVFVSDEDLSWADGLAWHLSNGYPCNHIVGLMHRAIMTRVMGEPLPKGCAG